MNNILNKIRELYGSYNELPDNLTKNEINLIIDSSMIIKNKNKSGFYKINDYFYYLTNKNETIKNISKKIIPCHKLSQLIIKFQNIIFNKKINIKTIFNKKKVIIIPVAIPNINNQLYPRLNFNEKKRKDIFERWIPNGKKKLRAKCYCCNKNKIDIMNYHISHVVPLRKGGDNTINNLRPCCQTCNLSMSTSNLYEWQHKKYPKQFRKCLKK